MHFLCTPLNFFSFFFFFRRLNSAIYLKNISSPKNSVFSLTRVAHKMEDSVHPTNRIWKNLFPKTGLGTNLGFYDEVVNPEDTTPLTNIYIYTQSKRNRVSPKKTLL